jgi:hypothetical protein
MQFSRFFSPQWPFLEVKSWSKTAFRLKTNKQTRFVQFFFLGNVLSGIVET